jgi:hypothetical protein
MNILYAFFIKMKKIHTIKSIFTKMCLGLILYIYCFVSYTQAQNYILVDISLNQETIGNCKQAAGSEAIFKVKVFRQDSSIQKLNNIIVKDSLDRDLSFLSASATSGNYDSSTGLWSNIQLMLGDTAILTVKVKIKPNYEGGILRNYAWIKSIDTDFIDLDSVPGSQKIPEDDYDVSAVSVPLFICTNKNEKIELAAPKGFSTYQWFKNGMPIGNAVNDILVVNSIGEYSIVIDNATKCMSQSCCPIFIEEICFCPPTICIPIVISSSKLRN